MATAVTVPPSLKFSGGKPTFTPVKDDIPDEPDNDMKSIDKDALIELLTNKYTRAILSLTSTKECSACELSQELNIPLATVYRKLKLLENAKIIQNVKTIINLSCNEVKYYRCLIRNATVSFYNGAFEISLTKDERSDKVVRLWKRFPHQNGQTIAEQRS